MIDYSSVRRVLVYRLGSMGDTVVALPCLHLIARCFPNAGRTLLTNFPAGAKAAPASAVLGESGLIHDYMRYSVGTRNPFQLARLWWQIVQLHADILIYLMPLRGARTPRRDALFFRSAGLKTIIGLPDANGLRYLFDEETGLFEKEASRLARTISSLGDAGPDRLENWDLCLSRDEKKSSQRLLASLSKERPTIVCAPGSKMQAKDWGTQNWCSLAARLSIGLTCHSLVLVGAKEDEAVADTIAKAWPGESLNLCGRTSPRETAAVISRADLYLGPDSGPMHLAASVGVPIASPFAARAKPGVWFPAGKSNQIIYHKTSCAECGLETCIDRKKECLTSITVDDMYDAACRALSLKPQHV